MKLRMPCCSAQVDWPYAGFNLKGDLQDVCIDEYADAMEWNMPNKKWSNKAIGAIRASRVCNHEPPLAPCPISWNTTGTVPPPLGSARRPRSPNAGHVM